MLTPVFCNSFDIESGNQGKTIRKFSPYVPTAGIAHSFEQGALVAGRYGGSGWSIFNTAFWEMNYTALLPAPASVVVIHCNIQPRDGWPGTAVIFARFQTNNDTHVALQIRPDGKLDVVLGGFGRNGTGLVVQTTAAAFAVNDWALLEIRCAFGSSGNIRIWKEGVLIINYDSAALGLSCDRFTLRWEFFGPPGMAFDDLIIGVGDAAVERFGACWVNPVIVNADYRVGSWSVVNAWSGRPPGAKHYACVNDLATDHDRESPDDDTSYLGGDETAGDDLFGIAEPVCVGAILGLAVNVGALALSGAPQVRALFVSVDTGAPAVLGTLSPESARYAVQQVLIENSTVTGDRWTHQEITTGAWGIRAAGSGAQRVSVVYLEQIISMAGVLPFECGGGGSYIH